MNSILLIGRRGGTPGLFLIFILIWISVYSYESWRKRKIAAIQSKSIVTDKNYLKQRNFLLIIALIGLILPVRTLIEQIRIGVNTRPDYMMNAFETYSGKVILNFGLFFLIPFFISTIIGSSNGFLKKEFPTRLFNNLVLIMVVLVSFAFIVNSFHHT